MATARLTQQGVEVIYLDTGTPNARLTQQGNEVILLRSGTPKARVTQLGTEVIYVDSRKGLVANINATAFLTADLTLTEGHHLRVTHLPLEVIYTYNIDSTARVTGQYIEVIHSTEDLTGSFIVGFYSNAVVTANLSRAGAVQFAVDFVGTGNLQAILVPEQYPGNLLQLTQDVTTENVFNVTPSNTLSLSDEVSVGRATDVSASNVLLLSQLAVGGKLYNKVADNTLVLLQDVDPSRPVFSVLNFTHLAEGSVDYLPGVASNTLNLTQDVTYTADSNFSVSFTGTGTLDVLLTTQGDRSATSLLTFNQVAIGTLLNEYMTLQSPFEGPEHVITLPKPLVGNTENIVSDLLLKKSMNGVKRTYIKYNTSRRLTYTFSMTRNKGLEFEYFLKQHNGHSMKLTTWEGEIWRVFLITNPLSFNQPRRGAVCGPQVEIDLEFEGVQLSG